MSASIWDLPLPTASEEICTCSSCGDKSSSDLRGTRGWWVLRQRGIVVHASCRTCIAEIKPPRRNRA